VAICQEYAFLLPGLVGETIKLQRNGRRRGRKYRLWRSRVHRYWFLPLNDWRRRGLRLKDVSARPPVFGALAVLQQVSSKRWIQQWRCFASAWRILTSDARLRRRCSRHRSRDRGGSA